MLTAYGATVVTFMMLMYALERRGPGFVLAFAVGCALSSSYGFLSGTWPFGVVESIWCLVALDRFRKRGRTDGTDQPVGQADTT
jgi:hypothetical protein